MKHVLLILAAATAFVGGKPATGGDNPSTEKQLRINVSLWEGDPLGSREEGTIKLVAQPTLVTLDGRPFSFLSGGEIVVPDGRKKVRFVEDGVKVDGKPVLLQDGMVELTINLSNTTLVRNTEQRTDLQTQRALTITTVKQGETVKVRLKNAAVERQVWAEVSVEEVGK